MICEIGCGVRTMSSTRGSSSVHGSDAGLYGGADSAALLNAEYSRELGGITVQAVVPDQGRGLVGFASQAHQHAGSDVWMSGHACQGSLEDRVCLASGLHGATTPKGKRNHPIYVGVGRQAVRREMMGDLQAGMG